MAKHYDDPDAVMKDFLALALSTNEKLNCILKSSFKSSGQSDI